MEFLQNHWIEIALVVYGAASEIIGISPLKSNSVVQLVLQLLGNFLKSK